MHGLINEAIGSASFTALMARSGATPMPISQPEFVAIVTEEVALLDAFFKENNV
ncbi:hypothetical protein [Prosthecomicrobium sp. N25]|uniref:hypothetical protein n=1 Tax=Prosthecomicrobium sp. N25 TaxID=3129254 RepID=UPI003077CE8B